MNLQRTFTRSPVFLLGLLGLALFTSPVPAQVFDSGRSNQDLFDSFEFIASVPSSIGDFQSRGGDGLTAQLNIFSSGSVGTNFEANSGIEINISGGGFVGAGFDANSGSEVNISGGVVDADFDANSGSHINISGGTIGNSFGAHSGSEVNLFGGDFALDGVALDLTINETLTIIDRDVTLTGLFHNGQAFSFDLNSTEVNNADFFDPAVPLTVTGRQIPIIGDVNLDGEVNFEDIPPFICVLVACPFVDEADVNHDDVVNFGDIPPFIAILMAQ